LALLSNRSFARFAGATAASVFFDLAGNRSSSGFASFIPILPVIVLSVRILPCCVKQGWIA
jgi:hypothetical protein